MTVSNQRRFSVSISPDKSLFKTLLEEDTLPALCESTEGNSHDLVKGSMSLMMTCNHETHFPDGSGYFLRQKMFCLPGGPLLGEPLAFPELPQGTLHMLHDYKGTIHIFKVSKLNVLWGPFHCDWHYVTLLHAWRWLLTVHLACAFI